VTKYRDNMTEAEAAQLARECAELDAAYADNATRCYRVSWVIDVEACSFVEAARMAVEMHRDPESLAVFYDVEELDGANGLAVARQTINADTWQRDLFAYNETPADESAELHKAALSRGQP
jgi:hypothetical protein